MTKHLALTAAIASLASDMGEAFSGPARSTSMFGGFGTPLFDDADPTAAVLGELKKIETGLHAKLEDQNREIKAAGQTSKDTRDEIVKLEKKYDEQQARLTEIQTKMGRLDMSGGQAEERKSLGQRFVESAEYKSARERGEIKTEKAQLGSIYERKALDSTNASAGTLVIPQRVPGIVRPNERVRVRDLLAQGRTESNAVEFFKETGFTNNAAAVPEGTKAGFTGKPQSNITFSKVTIPVATVAHWIPATRQIIADASQLRSYIDTRLLDGLGRAEDRDLMYGDGTGDTLLGIIPQATAYNRAQAGDSKIDTLRRSMTQVRLAEYEADGIVLHPSDWEDIELAKGSDGHYIWISVNSGGEQRLFRVPVVDTTAIDEGEFLTGAYSLAAMLWDREEANIRTSDSHSDYFVKNMIAILAEMREALTVFRPEAFIHGDFADVPPAP